MNTQSKIVSLTTLKKKIAAARRQGKKIAFTNGCFDILHRGHVTYLEKAARSGQTLVVGLNSDQSVRSIKGPQRPIVAEGDRARVLAALAAVDLITIFHEDTPYKLISSVKPDVLIKGADWKGKEVVGSDIVRANGGKVRLIEVVPDRSSTNIIGMVLAKCRA